MFIFNLNRYISEISPSSLNMVVKYLGSKNKVAKHLLPVVLKDRKPGQLYVEPFCGGCNMLDKVTGRRWANDSDFYLIELFKAINNGWLPPENVSPEMYRAIRLDKTAFPAPLVAFVGFTCTFGSKWFGGYAKNAKGRNYARESADNLLKQLPNLDGVTFTNLSYSEMDIEEPSIIYCDPPYANTVSYGANHFEHAPFWQWVRDKSKEGHTVFVSEYQAPDDFGCIKEVRTLTTMNKNAKDVRIEKLFVYAG